MLKALFPQSNVEDRLVAGFSPLKKSLTAIALALLITAVPAPAALASAEDVAQAEKMIWGSDGHSSPATGRLLLEKAISEGDLSAKRVLGLHLIFGWVLDKDRIAGFKLLNEAADAGDAAAYTKLGEIYLWGLTGETDLARARDFLETAIGLDDTKAMHVLGKQLVAGEKFGQDVEAGLALLKRAAAKKETGAYVTLGKLYMSGEGVPKDSGKALAAFEAAAALGDGQGLAIMGEDMMWREAGAAKAEALLLRAAELGTTEAYVTLAQGAMYGYLSRGAFSRKKYTMYSEKALEAGEGRVAILEAERSMWGIGRRASGPLTINGLAAEADNGNAQAAKFLVALLRDGNRYNVRKSTNAARDALEKYGDLFSEKEMAQFELSLNASTARTVAEFEVVAEAYASQPGLKSVRFGMDLYKANPNLAMYILQKRFKSEGTYTGSLNGYATRQTIRAMNKACAATLDMNLCNDSVMRPDVIGGLLAQE